MKLLREKLNAPLSTNLRKRYQSIIQYKGTARDLARKVFGTNVCESRGVIFSVKIKQVDQSRRYIYENIINEIAQPYNINKQSEASSSALIEELGSDEKYAKIAMAKFDVEVVSQVGTVFCEACYYLEVKSPLDLFQPKTDLVSARALI